MVEMAKLLLTSMTSASITGLRYSTPKSILSTARSTSFLSARAADGARAGRDREKHFLVDGRLEALVLQGQVCPFLASMPAMMLSTSLHLSKTIVTSAEIPTPVQSSCWTGGTLPPFRFPLPRKCL